MASESESSRKVTARDVAKKAGVSRWTVSRAFDDSASVSSTARERILQAAEELGYRPNLLARSLSKKRTNIIGLVVDEMKNPNLLSLLEVVTAELQKQGFIAMLLNATARGDYGQALSLADQFQVDGVIFLGTVVPDELIHLVNHVRHIPLVVLYRNSDYSDFQVVTTDGFTAGKKIAQLFVDEGYQRMGYMVGPATESTQLRRLEGYSERLSEVGVRLHELLDAGHYSRARGFQALSEYLQNTPAEARLEAIFCEDDILAIGAQDALVEHGLQGQMAIVGFDDIELASSPSYCLTTYRQPLELLVGEAVRRVSAESSAPRVYLAEGELVLRGSHQLTR